MKFIAVLLLLSARVAQADESRCLASIMYAEARGESVEGAVAVGQAAMNKAEREDATLCGLRGVHKHQPPKTMLEYYLSLARQLLKNPSDSVVKGADHWDSGKPHMPGKVTRVIGGHTFYTLQPEPESFKRTTNETRK